MSDLKTEVTMGESETKLPDRKPAPNAVVIDDVYKDPRKDKLERAWAAKAREMKWDAAQLAAAKKQWHIFFSRGDVDVETMTEDGYIPFEILDGKEKKQVKDRGDLMWMIPFDKVYPRMHAPGQFAAQVLSDTLHGGADKYQTKFDSNPQ